MTAHLIRGDARRLPLATGSVQCVVTSPPYFGLRSYGGQTSVWGGDPECSHQLEDGPAVKPMTGGPGAASTKQVTNTGSQFGNAWVEQDSPVVGRNDGGRDIGGRGGNYQEDGPRRTRGATTATCTRCGAWRGELGSEPTPQAFVSHLVEVMRECKRVLRDDGVAFVNMGDSMAGSGKGPTGHNGIGDQVKRQGFRPGNPDKNHGNSNRDGLGHVPGTRPKSLLLVPERLAIALSDDGWIVRSRIAWCKAAPMPESVRDRPTSAWEHIWMLTKSAKYYWDADASREDAKYGYSPTVRGDMYASIGSAEKSPERTSSYTERGTGGTRNLWNYWILPPDPYPGAHFATFPREIPRRCILAATSEFGACRKCGAAWRRTKEVIASWRDNAFPGEQSYGPGSGNPTARAHYHGGMSQSTYRETGWTPSCKCGPAAGVRPCVVLDPFSGSGTTAYVAASLGRVGIGVELSAEYTRQARYGRLAQDFLPFDAPAPPPEAPRLPGVG